MTQEQWDLMKRDVTAWDVKHIDVLTLYSAKKWTTRSRCCVLILRSGTMTLAHGAQNFRTWAAVTEPLPYTKAHALLAALQEWAGQTQPGQGHRTVEELEGTLS